MAPHLPPGDPVDWSSCSCSPLPPRTRDEGELGGRSSALAPFLFNSSCRFLPTPSDPLDLAGLSLGEELGLVVLSSLLLSWRWLGGSPSFSSSQVGSSLTIGNLSEVNESYVHTYNFILQWATTSGSSSPPPTLITNHEVTASIHS